MNQWWTCSLGHLWAFGKRAVFIQVSVFTKGCKTPGCPILCFIVDLRQAMGRLGGVHLPQQARAPILRKGGPTRRQDLVGQSAGLQPGQGSASLVL